MVKVSRDGAYRMREELIFPFAEVEFRRFWRVESPDLDHQPSREHSFPLARIPEIVSV